MPTPRAQHRSSWARTGHSASSRLIGPDPNSVLAATASTLAKDFIKSLTSSVSKAVIKRYSQYFESFSSYLERTYTSCSSVKTIINKENPYRLDEIYVKTRFKCQKDRIVDDLLCQYIRDRRRVVVTGFGGIGKTIFCKYLFCSIFNNPQGVIPVFFELRRINEISNKNLSAYLRISLSPEPDKLPEDIFKLMMNDGRFIFILDGFDEIPDEFKNDIQKQILELSHLHQKCGFVVSSRFDDRFASWQEFYVYRALPFEKDQTLEVVQKVKFDKDTKKEFIQNIFEKRYDNYKGFFSTPLLTLMMLMTYLQIRHIPDNVHIFYRYAFQTLFTLHDASKEGFQRKRKVNLSEQQFMEIFSIFCIATYSDMKHTFNESECIQYIDKAKRRISGNFDSFEFLSDATDAVNMLFKDGDQYTFIHRSFQEYFAAYAITHYFLKPIRELMKRLPRRDSDSVFSMARAMNPSAIDEFYLLPEYMELESEMISLVKETDPVEILGLLNFRIDLGLRFEDGRFEPSMYGGYSMESLDRFVNIAFMMFKDLAPKEILDLNESKYVLQSLRYVGKFLQRKLDLYNKEESFLDAQIILRERRIQISLPGSGSKDGEIYESISLDDAEITKNIPVIQHLASVKKARAVFVKKVLDEIKRNHKRARAISDDILSM